MNMKTNYNECDYRATSWHVPENYNVWIISIYKAKKLECEGYGIKNLFTDV